MKKLLTIILALAMLFTCVTALADETEKVWDVDPAGQYLGIGKTGITIRGLIPNADPAKNGEPNTLPAEYHVRVVWDNQDGQFDASQVMCGSSKAIVWDKDALKYKLQEGTLSYAPWESDESTTKPKVRFEVTNASTPGMNIFVTAKAIDEDNAWMPYLNAEGTTISGDSAMSNWKKSVNAVAGPSDAAYGTGVLSRANGAAAWAGSVANTKVGTYAFSWNYEALVNEALGRLVTGETSALSLEANFAVTITPYDN